MHTKEQDGKWGWVIAVGNLYVTAIFAATMRCYSVFYLPLMAEFSVDYGEVSWINGSMQLAYGLSCAIGSGLLQKFGIRPTVMFFGLVAGISCFTASFLNELWQVQMCMGTIIGTSIGPIMLGAFTQVSRYFHKRLYTAMQVMCIGISIGPLVACPFYQILIDYFGWRGAVQILGGLFLNLMVSGALMRPIVLPSDKPVLKNKDKNNNKTLAQKPTKASSFSSNCKNLKNEEFFEENLSKNYLESSSEDDDYITSQILSVVEVDGGKRRLQQKALRNRHGRRKSSVYDNAIVLAHKIDLVVFANPMLYFYTFAWVGFGTAYFSTLVYLVPYGQKAMGFDMIQASSLISAFAIGEIIARAFIGFVIDKLHSSKRLVLVAILFLGMSVVVCIIPFMTSYVSLVALVALMGIMGGGMDGVFSAIIVEIFGLNLYSSAFGYSNIFIHAVGTGTTVLMGVAVDKTSSFSVVFYIGSCSLVFGAINALILNYFLNKKNKCKNPV